MNRNSLKLLTLGLLAACPKAPMNSSNPTTPSAPAAVSGIDVQFVDATVRPQDDFYKYVNGKWLESTPIPADKSRIGSFTTLADDAEIALRTIIENAAKDPNRQPGSEAQKIGDLFASFMDEATIEQKGLAPLHAAFAQVDALADKKEIPALIGKFGQLSIDAPIGAGIHQDNKDSTKYVVDIGQSGLGLPDRDYYLTPAARAAHGDIPLSPADEAKMKEVLGKYQAHIVKMLTLAGDANAATAAAAIIALESELALQQWTKVENRNPNKTYNKVELAKLGDLAPGFDWKRYLVAAGVDGKVDYLIISQPTYIAGFNKILHDTPLATWKAYFRWQILGTYAPYLSKAFVDESFAFYGTVLSGVPENRPRWKRGVSLVEGAVGEGLGKLYVAQYFPPASKARMETLVANLLKAYEQSIDTLDWMSAETKHEARAKLAKFTPKIGYPKTWRDYSSLNISATDLIGNLERARQFEYTRNVNKLGKPIDRDEWGMTPQTVNAYYNPELNEIVFPAAILQPPFFNPAADDAVNYGGIGAVIGHEISHGFDDQGAQYDGNGNLRDWWTKDDHAKFAAKTQALIAQYAAQEAVPGYHVNGELTLGENIADNSGLAIAYKAYQLSLNGGAAPVIDGLSGAQRLYMGWAQVWRGKTRENEAIRRIKTDPHSPASIRGSVTLTNQPGFFKAFDIKPTDKLFVAPEKQIIIW